MKKLLTLVLVLGFLVPAGAGCTRSSAGPARPYYVPPQTEGSLSGSASLTKVYEIPYALLTGRIGESIEVSVGSDAEKLQELMASFGLGDNPTVPYFTPFGGFVFGMMLTDRQYEAMKAAYRAYLPDLLEQTVRKLFPAVQSVEYGLGAGIPTLSSFRVRLREKSLPENGDWKASDASFELRRALLSIQTGYNTFLGAETTRDLRIDWVGEETVLASETIAGGTECRRFSVSLFGLEMEPLREAGARELAETAEACGARQIFLPNEAVARRYPDMIFVEIGGEGLEKARLRSTESLEQTLKDLASEDPWIREIAPEWASEKAGITGLRMTVHPDRLPSGDWPDSEGRRLLNELWPKVNALNDLYGRRLRDLTMRIADAQTGEILREWEIDLGAAY